MNEHTNDNSTPDDFDKLPEIQDGLDDLLRAWHAENAATAARSRDALLQQIRSAKPMERASLPASAITPAHSANPRSHSPLRLIGDHTRIFTALGGTRSTLMTRFAPAAAAAIVLAALLTIFEPGLPGAPDRTQASNTVMLPNGGNLDARTPDGQPIGPCPLKHTDVSVEISGPFARVTVRQQFTNPYDDKIEALYTFPLSHRGAVDRMTMTVGKRVIVGEVHERQAARQMYEAARDAGHVAALLEQERPNIFSQSVANIEPNAEITVEISYVELLESRDGEYEFSFPMTVAPRYIPCGTGVPPVHEAADAVPDADGASPWLDTQLADSVAENPEAPGDESADPDAELDPRHVPDAANITPPVSHPDVRSGHDISLAVTLDTGGPAITDIYSRQHATVRTIEGFAAGSDKPRRMRIKLDRDDEIPNRDFVLNWRTDDDTIVEAVFTHAGERGGFVTLMLAPPEKITPDVLVPRELVFVLDTSGSMSGTPIESAKSVIAKALDTMQPEDTFNIITFAGDTSILWPQPRPATDANLAEARKFVESRNGNGGTEMMKAIYAALEQSVDGVANVRSADQLAVTPADGRRIAMRALGRDIRIPGARASGAGDAGTHHVFFDPAKYVITQAGEFAGFERLMAVPDILWRLEGRWTQVGDAGHFLLDKAEPENTTVHDDSAVPIESLCNTPADGRAVVVYADGQRFTFDDTEYVAYNSDDTSCPRVDLTKLGLSKESLAEHAQWVFTGWWRNQDDGQPALEVGEAGPLTIPAGAVTAARLRTLPADGRTVFVRVNCEDAAMFLDPATKQQVEGLDAGFGEFVRATGLDFHRHDDASSMLLTGVWASDASGAALLEVASAVHIPRKHESPRPLRVVCFLTDGEVGNDQAIIDAVRRNSHTTRVFSFGIGTSVNRYLLDSVAEAGRGEASYVLNMEEAQAAVDQFVTRLSAPVLTDIQVAFEGLEVLDVTPATLPDLWDERPIIVHARFDPAKQHAGAANHAAESADLANDSPIPGRGVLVIRGNASDGPYERILPLELPQHEPDHDVIATLWARAQVEDLMSRDLAAAQQGQFPDDLKQRVIELGETFQIMTQFTSFVAIERHRVTVGGQPRLVRVPVELPEGQSWEGTFGEQLVHFAQTLETPNVYYALAQPFGDPNAGTQETRSHTNREGEDVLYDDGSDKVTYELNLDQPTGVGAIAAENVSRDTSTEFKLDTAQQLAVMDLINHIAADDLDALRPELRTALSMTANMRLGGQAAEVDSAQKERLERIQEELKSRIGDRLADLVEQRAQALADEGRANDAKNLREQFADRTIGSQLVFDQLAIAGYRNLEREVRRATMESDYVEAERLADVAANLAAVINNAQDKAVLGAEAKHLSEFVLTEERAAEEQIVLSKQREISARESERIRLLEETKQEQVANLMERARDLQRERKLDDSVEVLDQVLAIDPNNPNAAWMRDTLEDVARNARGVGTGNVNAHEQQRALTAGKTNAEQPVALGLQPAVEPEGRGARRNARTWFIGTAPEGADTSHPTEGMIASADGSRRDAEFISPPIPPYQGSHPPMVNNKKTAPDIARRVFRLHGVSAEDAKRLAEQLKQGGAPGANRGGRGPETNTGSARATTMLEDIEYSTDATLWYGDSAGNTNDVGRRDWTIDTRAVRVPVAPPAVGTSSQASLDSRQAGNLTRWKRAHASDTAAQRGLLDSLGYVDSDSEDADDVTLSMQPFGAGDSYRNQPESDLPQPGTSAEQQLHYTTGERYRDLNTRQYDLALRDTQNLIVAASPSEAEEIKRLIDVLGEESTFETGNDAGQDGEIAGSRFVEGGGGGGGGGRGIFGGGGSDDREAGDDGILYHDNIRYPKNWLEMRAKRKSTDEIDDAESHRTRERLKTVLPEVRFDNVPFEQAIEQLRAATGVNIVPNWSALEAAAIEKDTEVSLRLNNVSAEKVIDLVLDEVGAGEVELSHEIEEGVVTVSTREDLSRKTKTIIYNIRDLIISVPTFRGHRIHLDQIGKPMDGSAAQKDPSTASSGGIPVSERTVRLMELIQATIDPESWREAGGTTGSISAIGDDLVITQSSMAHRQIQDMFRQLRDVVLYQPGTDRNVVAALNTLRHRGIDEAYRVALVLQRQESNNDALVHRLVAMLRMLRLVADGAPLALGTEQAIFAELNAIHAEASAGVAREAAELKALARKADEPILAWALSPYGAPAPAGLRLRGGRAEVSVLLGALDAATRQALADAGFTIEAEIPDARTVVGLAPLAALRPLAAMDDVKRIAAVE